MAASPALTHALAAALARALPGPERDAVTDGDLAVRVAEAVDAARAAWPGIALVDDDAVAQAVAAALRGDDATPASVAEAIPQLRLVDLLLASRLAVADPVALAAFDHQLIPAVRRHLATMQLRTDVVDEALQILRTRLLVGDGAAPPRIAAYSGRAALATWLRTAALRDTLMLMRRDRETPVADDDLALVPMLGDDTELAAIKSRAQSEFKVAFEAAVAHLTPRQRNFLRHSALDGLTIDDLGRLHGVHRATAARWLADARERLARRLRRVLGERLHITPSEIDSLERLVRSQIDLSLHRVLSPAPEADDGDDGERSGDDGERSGDDGR